MTYCVRCCTVERMSATRKFGMRRVMTPNQIVALNVARARALRGWTQEQAAEALAPLPGRKAVRPQLLGPGTLGREGRPDQAVLRR